MTQVVCSYHRYDAGDRVWARSEQIAAIVKQRIGDPAIEEALYRIELATGEELSGSEKELRLKPRGPQLQDEHDIPVSPPDPIKPAHYKHGDAYEALRVMLEWHGIEPVVSFCQLTAEKYLARAGKKEGEPRERDFRKAAFYLNHAADLLEKK